MHGTAFGPGSLLNLGNIFDKVDNPLQQGIPTVFMCHFTASEKDAHLTPITFFDKSANMSNLGFQVVVIGFGSELDFLELDSGLFFPCQLLLFLLLILILPIIHYLTDRRTSVRCYLNKIKAKLLSRLQGLVRRHHAKLRSIVGYYPYFAYSNLPIPSGASRLYSSFLPF